MFTVVVKFNIKNEEICFSKILNKVLITDNVINLGSDRCEKVIQITRRYLRVDVKENNQEDYKLNYSDYSKDLLYFSVNNSKLTNENITFENVRELLKGFIE